MWDEPNEKLRCQKQMLRRFQKGCRFIWTAGRWPRKSESAKKCVTTYLPNESVPKMDGAKAFSIIIPILPYQCDGFPIVETLVSRRKRGGHCELWGRRLPRKWPLVQILVVVAITQERSLRTEVEKGSIWTAVAYGSAGPKRLVKAYA